MTTILGLWSSVQNAMASQTFLEHYVAYLTSWKGCLAVVFVAVLTSGVWQERRRRLSLARSGRKGVVRGCFRYGLYEDSQLEDQYRESLDRSQSDQKRRTTVKAIFVYPIKSCRGVELQRAGVTSTGLVCDRIFSFAQLVSTDTSHQWRFITQREFPRLALLETELWLPSPEQDVNPNNRIKSWAANGGCLVVHFPYPTDSRFGPSTETITIKLPLNPTLERSIAKRYEKENIAVWTDAPLAINITNEIDATSLAKLKYFLGVSNPLGLFKQDDDNLRQITRSLPADATGDDYRVGFPDAFPVSILNLASVRDIDASLPANNVAKGNLDARRFRANIYVSGPEAYAEDRWTRISIGTTAREDGRRSSAAVYHAACRTARCNLPNVDPMTGIKDRNEPGTTLRRTRQVDEGAKPHPCLGLSLIPLLDRGVFKIGDEVKVLETGEHFYEKMFP